MSQITYGPEIDYQLCTGCGQCYEDCPMDVFGWDKDKKEPTVAYLSDCSGCCVCEIVCPEVAIDVHLPLHARIDLGIFPEKGGGG